VYWEQITFEVCPLEMGSAEVCALEEQMIRDSDPE
jgi:hypothetical protein